MNATIPQKFEINKFDADAMTTTRLGALKHIKTERGWFWLVVIWAENANEDLRKFYRSFDQAHRAARKFGDVESVAL